jgi:hypothetical protein
MVPATEDDMARFTADNTNGYTDEDLAELNAAYDEIIGSFQLDDDPMVRKTVNDDFAETLLARFDNGLRGAELVA